MRILLWLLPLLTACNDTLIYPRHFHEAELMCRDHGGLKYFYVESFVDSHHDGILAYCRDAHVSRTFTYTGDTFQ